MARIIVITSALGFFTLALLVYFFQRRFLYLPRQDSLARSITHRQARPATVE